VTVAIEIVVVALLILLNGFFAMSETAFVSSRKTRLQQLADEGNANARTALSLLEDPPRFLSTVQAWITLVGILMGALGGATLGEELSRIVARAPLLAPWAEAIGVAVVVIVTTFFSIILGELIPKQIALRGSERITLAVARVVRFLSLVLYPLVRLLSLSSGLVLRILRVPQHREQPVSEEEIKVMIDQGIEHGTFAPAERDMIEGVFDLGDRRVNELMTTRSDIVWLDVSDGRDEVLRRIRESAHSRFPLCRDGLDTVLGIVRARDVLGGLLAGGEPDLTRWVQPAVFVPEHALALKALETFRKARRHVALAVDEYGVVQGFITVYDIMEAVVGDFPSLDEPEEPMAVHRKDGSWLLDGLLPIDRFKEIFSLSEELPAESSYQTLGGFIMASLGRIPAVADVFEWGALRLEVMDMDGVRVDKVLAVPREPAGLPEG
jgi:putative hemolysin